jgi:hypothetical protein
MKKKKQPDPLGELAGAWRTALQGYEGLYKAIVDLYPQLREQRAALTKAERAFRERYWQRHGVEWASCGPPETDDEALKCVPEEQKT